MFLGQLLLRGSCATAHRALKPLVDGWTTQRRQAKVLRQRRPRLLSLRLGLDMEA